MPIPAPPPSDDSGLSYGYTGADMALLADTNPGASPLPDGGAPPLTYQLGGLVFNGPRDTHGVRWYAAELDGWDSADVRSTLDDRSGDHGSYAGQSYYTARNLTLTGTFEAPNETAMFDARARLHTATNLLGPGYGTLRVNEQPPKVIRVRRSGRLQMRSIGKRVVQFQVGLLAPDPRKYSADVTTPHTGLPVTGGGIRFPIRFPVTFGGSLHGGQVIVVNDGTDPARPVITINGPVVNPQVAVPALGRTIALDMTIPTGSQVTINLASRAVVLNGTASRRNTLTAASRWFEIPPGRTTVTFRGERGGRAALMTVTARSVWL